MARFEVCLIERQLTSQLHRDRDVPTHRPDFWPWPLTAVSCDTFHWGDSADVHIFRPTIVLPLWPDYCSTFNPDNEDLGSPYDSVWDLVECQYNTKTMNLLIAELNVDAWFCRFFHDMSNSNEKTRLTAVPFNIEFEIKNLGFLWAQNSLFGHSGRLFGPVIGTYDANSSKKRVGRSKSADGGEARSGCFQ